MKVSNFFHQKETKMKTRFKMLWRPLH